MRFLSTVIVVVLNEFFLLFREKVKRLIHDLLIDELVVLFLLLMLRYSPLFRELMPLTEPLILIHNDFSRGLFRGPLHNFKIYFMQPYCS